MSSTPAVMVAVSCEHLRQQLIEFLHDCDAHVVAVPDGDSALALCLDIDFSLMIIDKDLPKMMGYPAYKVIRLNDRNAEAPIILLSNDATFDAVVIHDESDASVSHHSMLQPDAQLQISIRQALYGTD